MTYRMYDTQAAAKDAAHWERLAGRHALIMEVMGRWEVRSW